MQKRGISNVIQTVLIILLALAALILIWLVARKFLLETNETSEINARFFLERLSKLNNLNLTLLI